ncbi:MAG: S8 family serine peptidase [Acidobacteria bacterium]|nr:S8 family serine peptidase [Acidobacteriota bacterium]
MTHPIKEFRVLPSFLALALFSMFSLVVWSASAQVQTAPEPDSAVRGTSGNYIVTFRSGTSQADRAASVRRAGAALRFNYSIVDAVAITGAGVNEIAALQRDISVLEIIPDRPVRAFAQTTPEGVTRVGVPVSGSSDGSGIGVAIVDTGMDFAQTDLAPAPNDVPTTAFSAFGSSCQDDEGHGTHVTGIVAALDNNNIGVVGVAPNATPYCVKVLDSTGSGSDSDVMAGLDWVFSNRTSVTPNIRVVNMSLGRTGTLNDNSALRASVQALYNNGVAVVVAAGNDPSKEVKNMVPATYPEVFAIASTTAKDGTNFGCSSFTGTIKADTASFFTTDGKFDARSKIGVTISAPGATQEDVTADCFASSVGILSLKLGGDTTRMSGTSMASPHVAGIVARLMQSGLSGLETIRSTIRDGADRKGEAPLNSPTFGYTFDREREGIAQAPGLVPPPPPPDGFTLTANGYKVKGLQKADLAWTGATSATVDVFRNNANITTTVNDGAYTDNINQRGGGSYTYKVCEAGTTTCSNDATVTF